MCAASDHVARMARLLAGVPTSEAGTIAHERTVRVDVRPGLIVGAAAAAASIPAVQRSLLLWPAGLSTESFAELLVLVAVQFGVVARRGAWF